MDMIQNGLSESQNTTQRFEVLQELGDCYASVGDLKRAQHFYEKATDAGPDEAGPYVGLGVIAIQNESLEEAEIAFKVACRLDNRNARAYAGLAMVAQQRCQHEKAFEMYLKCLELDTDNLAALLGLFQTSCEMGTFAQVIHYLEIYLEMHPGDISVMFSLAALYTKEGQYNRSKEILMDILALDPENSDAANLMEEVDHNLARKSQQKTAGLI